MKQPALVPEYHLQQRLPTFFLREDLDVLDSLSFPLADLKASCKTAGQTELSKSTTITLSLPRISSGCFKQFDGSRKSQKGKPFGTYLMFYNGLYFPLG